MNRLENRISFNNWNEENNLVIPKNKKEEYRAWYNANLESFKKIGFTDKEMFEYFSSCLTENRKYSIKDVLK
jgi:hypothetical protein